MHAPWTTIVTVGLASFASLAEMNMIRMAVCALRDASRARRPDPPDQRGTSPTADARVRRIVRAPAPRLSKLLHAAAGGLLTTAALGQPDSQPVTHDAPAPPSSEAAAPADARAAGGDRPGDAFSLQLNLDYVTQYFYHGIIQEDSGLILQPAARLTANLFTQDDLKIDAFVASWNSFHGQETGATTTGDFTSYWYESDIIGGVTLTAGKISLSAAYVILTSPSDAYETVQELDLTLAIDDSEWLGAFALHPYVLVGIETGADASDGGNSDPGTYLELGIAPGFSFDVGKTPMAMTFPVAVGLSLHDYYQDGAGDDETFGYVQVGVKASIPLPFGDRYGTWTLNAGVSGMFLGNHTKQYNAGDDTEVIGLVGLQVNF